MTRDEKVAADLQLGQTMLDAIRTLDVFPPGYGVSVQVSQRRPRAIFHSGRKRSAGRPKGGPSVGLILPPNWMEAVFEQGVARVGHCFILKAVPILIPAGASGAWRVITVELSRRHPFGREAAIVSYGGRFCIHATAELAMQELLANFRVAMLGEDVHP